MFFLCPFGWEVDFYFWFDMFPLPLSGQKLMADEVETHADTIDLTYLTGRSIDDALAESLSGEIFLFVITCK